MAHREHCSYDQCSDAEVTVAGAWMRVWAACGSSKEVPKGVGSWIFIRIQILFFTRIELHFQCYIHAVLDPLNMDAGCY